MERDQRGAELRAALVAFHGVGPWTADSRACVPPAARGLSRSAAPLCSRRAVLPVRRESGPAPVCSGAGRCVV
ncbi:hypothetical protein, partial [Clavibacter michiganensis]|uniref:hypothetical protein n=1 Tax=Clavibacter michiganensis TaxID=28447 RepID=UPI00292F9DDC